jgi:hypothetical protein
MLLMARRRLRQRGQALILVLVFVAAFLLLTWAALTLASGAFLSLSSVQADTRSTYALDAGVAYGLEYLDLRKGNGCNRPNPGPFTLTYPNGTSITVTAVVTKTKSCAGNSGLWDISVTATGTSRSLLAEVSQASGAWSIAWEQFQ